MAIQTATAATIPTLLTPTQARARLACSRSTLHRLVNEGHLRIKRLPMGGPRYDMRDIDALLQKMDEMADAELAERKAQAAMAKTAPAHPKNNDAAPRKRGRPRKIQPAAIASDDDEV